ncbi:MAG TPA: hypothetical protein HPP76_06180 [Desulfuromonadales bacterium]|nr:hypothetical protein [Desulfuromonadales bacterium]
MSKGHQANKERLDEISSFGKSIGKRAGFKCEWCEDKDDLRIWDHQPDKRPNIDSLAMLCKACRDLADGRKADSDELRSIRNALWSNVPAVAEGAAKVLAQCNISWVRDAIEQSCIDDALKEQLLNKSQMWR